MQSCESGADIPQQAGMAPQSTCPHRRWPSRWGRWATCCYLHSFALASNPPVSGFGVQAQPHAFCCGSSSCSPPQVVRSLKKAMAPVLSDVSVEWVFPESTEALVSPLSSSCLFPGDRLVGYSIICDTSLYISKPRAVSATLLPLSLPAWLRSPWHRCAKPNAGTALLSPGQEAAVQHHALPGVGQLRFLSFPRRGDRC